MSLLRKSIRKILLEALSGAGSFSINPAVKRFCDGFLAGKNPELHVSKSGSKMQITLFADSTMAGTVIYNNTTKSQGNCLNAMRVSWADSSPKFSGASIICYDLAMEILGSSEFNSGLIGDRKEVSHPLWSISPVFLSPKKHKGKGFAYKTWKKYATRTDVKKTLLDPLGFQFTPEIEDDCDPGSAFALYALERNKDYQKFISKKRSNQELVDFGFDFQDSEEMKKRAEEDSLFRSAYSKQRSKRKTAFNSIIKNDPKLLAQIESDWKSYGIPLLIMYSKDSLPTWEYLVNNGATLKIGSGKGKISKALGGLAKKKIVNPIGVITDLPDGFVP